MNENNKTSVSSSSSSDFYPIECMNLTNSSAEICLEASMDFDDHNQYSILIKHQYILLGWIAGLFILIGIVGNMFVIKILLQPNMRVVSTNIFLTGLAISDLCALIIMFFLIPMRYILVSHGVLFFYELHTFLFPYLYPLCITFQFCSIYMTVSACTNRTIVVYSSTPIGDYHKLNDPRSSLKAVIGVFCVSLLICIPFWFMYDTTIDHDEQQRRVYLKLTQLAMSQSYRFLVHGLLTTVVTYVIPQALLIVMNYFLIVAVVKTRRRKLDLGLRERNENYITLMLVMIVLSFVVCQMPNLIIHIIHALNVDQRQMTYWHQWATFLLILNTSSNFAIYCFFGENFRNAVKNLYCLGKSKFDPEHIEIEPMRKMRKLSSQLAAKIDQKISYHSAKSYHTLNNAN